MSNQLRCCIPQHMILRHKIFYAQHLQLRLLAFVLFLYTINTCLYGFYYTM